MKLATVLLAITAATALAACSNSERTTDHRSEAPQAEAAPAPATTVLALTSAMIGCGGQAQAGAEAIDAGSIQALCEKAAAWQDGGAGSESTLWLN